MKKRGMIKSGFACVLMLMIAASSQAATILKLDLSGVGPDVGMNGGGVLATTNDGNGGTTGNQNTAIQYTGFLEGILDVPTAVASFSLSGLLAAGPATGVGPVVIQPFVDGSFILYDASNTVLLSGALNTSVLTGTLGPPGTGSVFTTSFADVTGGTLQPLIQPGSLSLTIGMTSVNGGSGFAIGAGGGPILPFLADASVEIAAEPIPEPASFALLGIAGLVAMGRRR